MAALVKRTFDAAYVALILTTSSRSRAIFRRSPAGADSPPGQVVGAVTLGRATAAATAHPPGRLADYARLTEAVVTVARERAHWQNLAWTDDVSTLRNRRYFNAA
jgi:hypothetical protein